MAFGQSYLVAMIADEISKLNGLLAAIQKWRLVAQAEFEKKRVDYGSSEPDEFTQESFFDEEFQIEQVERAMYAALAVSINAYVEHHIKSFCSRLGISSGRSLPDMWEKIKERINKDAKEIDKSGFDSAEKARLWGNAFKHNSGTKNKAFVDLYGGVKGEVLEYEKEDWQTTIAEVHQLLISLDREASTILAQSISSSRN